MTSAACDHPESASRYAVSSADTNAAVLTTRSDTQENAEPRGGKTPVWFDSDRAFQGCAALALSLHLALIFGRSGLWGGDDLVPHLRLIQTPHVHGLVHNIYAPAYHVLGALATRIIDLALYPKLFAAVAAVLLIAGFRFFQRAAGLPSACAAIFCLTPFALSLSWCTPRIEAAGYGLMLFGLGFQLRGQRVALAVLLALAFYVHTASALLFGIAGGVLALARREPRDLAALAVGSLGVIPLLAVHLSAGCSISEAFLFARGGYTRALAEPLIPPRWPWILPLAGPVGVLAAVLGARELWRGHRTIGIVCAALLCLYFNNLWLAPFELRTAVTLLRGLSVLAIPVAVAAGVYASRSWRTGLLTLAAAAVFSLFASARVVPNACFVRPIELAEIAAVSVDRCQFLWRAPKRIHANPGASRRR